MADASASQPVAPPDPDASLVERAKGGDFTAFEELVNRYERPLYNLARRIVHHDTDAQEIVQDTFVSVVEHLDSFAGRSTFQTWLMRIATNRALKVLRRRKTVTFTSLSPTSTSDDQTPLPHPEFIAQWTENPEHLAQRREIRQELEEALGELDEKYRLVFVLRDMQGLSTEETAEALELSVANVKVRLLRARLMLRERLTRRFGDESRRVMHSHEG